MPEEDFAFSHEMRVRWAEADMQGIVFNGHYQTYFDVGFTEYWRKTDLPGALAQSEQGRELFARKSTIEYHAPARFDDELDVCVRTARIGHSSLTIALEIHRRAPPPKEFLVSGELIYVYADTATRTPQRIPSHWRDVLTAFEKSAIQS